MTSILGLPLTVFLQSDDGGVFAALFGGVWLLFSLAITLLMVVGLWKIFTKAGKAGWLSLIPLVNMVILAQIVGWDGLKILALFVPFLNIIFGLILFLDLARAFGKGSGFGVGLFLLPVIFIPMLGFDSSTYLGPQPGGVLSA